MIWRRLRKHLSCLTLNGDGFISEGELREVMHKLGEKLSDEQINTMMIVADVDEDGKIGFEDFQALMTGKTSND